MRICTSALLVMALAYLLPQRGMAKEFQVIGVSTERVVSILEGRGRSVGSSTVAGRLNENTAFLAEQLHRNALAEVRDRKTIINSIMDIDDLGKSSTLGRLVGEHLAHHLSLRRWQVFETKLAVAMSVTEAGESSITRVGNRKPIENVAENVVTGTYTVTNDGVLITLKMLEVGSGRLVSSAQSRIPRDRFINHLIGRDAKETPFLTVGK